MVREGCGLSGKCSMCNITYHVQNLLTLLIVSVYRYTADILDETKNVLLDAGMNRVLPKPEPMHAFQTELRTMIQRAAAAGSANVNEA